MDFLFSETTLEEVRSLYPPIVSLSDKDRKRMCGEAAAESKSMVAKTQLRLKDLDACPYRIFHECSLSIWRMSDASKVGKVEKMFSLTVTTWLIPGWHLSVGTGEIIWDVSVGIPTVYVHRLNARYIFSEFQNENCSPVSPPSPIPAKRPPHQVNKIGVEK